LIHYFIIQVVDNLQIYITVFQLIFIIIKVHNLNSLWMGILIYYFHNDGDG
jgi:hypothetical protein